MRLPDVTRPPPTALEMRIAASVQESGPIGVDAFMARALYDAQDGYYVTGQPIGAQGDFTTAPEISQVFGELIGLWLAQSWLDLGSPSPFHLIELGPGRGTLLGDILRVCAKVSGFHAALTLHLVDTNQPLRALQRQTLSRYNPYWHDNLSTVPDGPSLIIGNEFLDCMPIRQFVQTKTGWHEKQVGCDDAGRLCFGLGPLLPLPPGIAAIGDPLGSVREVAPQLPSFVAQLANRFENNVGRALLIDYGDPSGKPGDTLQALYNHTKSHPLDHVGQSDLTAHVDFSALQSLAQKAGLDCPEAVSQRTFLQSLGIEARAQALIAANPHCANDVQGAVDRLIGEAHMGALFRVVCIDSRHNEGRGPPLGF